MGCRHTKEKTMIVHTAFPANDNKSVLIVMGRFPNGITEKEMNTKKSFALNCTPEQYTAGIEAYIKGGYMQDAFPFLSKEEAEFLISGLTPSDWAKIFGTDLESGF
jgi:hypothetical protein